MNTMGACDFLSDQRIKTAHSIKLSKDFDDDEQEKNDKIHSV